MAMGSRQRRSCYLCGSREQRPWAEENGYEAVQCTDCGLVYVSNPPAAEAVDEAAQTGLHQTARGSVSVVGRRQPSKVAEYRALLTRAYGGSLGAAPLTWLDIGAGFGELLEAVLSIAPPGSRAVGIDPCLPKVAAARARGLSMTSQGLAEVAGPFDVVSLIHVFSHLIDPIAFMRSLTGLLAATGEVLLVTGNGAEVERTDYVGPLYLPDHLSFAGETQLRRIFGQAGFEVLAIDRRKYAEPHNWVKNLARRVLGRPPVVVTAESRFAILTVRARRREEPLGTDC
jgi:SAM-dependent methyltransferase